MAERALDVRLRYKNIPRGKENRRVFGDPEDKKGMLKIALSLMKDLVGAKPGDVEDYSLDVYEIKNPKRPAAVLKFTKEQALEAAR